MTAFADSTRQSAARYKETFVNKLGTQGIYEKIGGVYDKFLLKVNWQERRMMRAFPSLKSIRYDDALQKVKEWLHGKRNGKRKK